MVFSILTFVLWGVADLFYKKGNSKKNDKYSDLKTGIIEKPAAEQDILSCSAAGFFG